MSKTRANIKTMRTTTNYNAIRVDLPKLLRIYLMPKIAADARHGTKIFNVFPSGFWSCFGAISFYYPIFTFRNKDFYLISLYVDVFNFLFIFIRAYG